MILARIYRSWLLTHVSLIVGIFSSFEPNAESQCETYLAQALQIEPITPEVYQTLASVRLSQQRVDEAKAALAQGLAIWLGSDRKFPVCPGGIMFLFQLAVSND